MSELYLNFKKDFNKSEIQKIVREFITENSLITSNKVYVFDIHKTTLIPKVLQVVDSHSNESVLPHSNESVLPHSNESVLPHSNESVTLDKCIEYTISLLSKEGISIFFLSYDSKEDRMRNNAKILNDFGFTKIPKIFINPREKGVVLRAIYDSIPLSLKNKKIIFCDDQIFNIKNATKYLFKRELTAILWNTINNKECCLKLISTF